MTDERSSLGVWREVVSRIQLNLPSCLKVSLAYRLLIAAILSPLAATAFQLALTMGGNQAVTDFGVVSVATSPLGLLGGAVAVGIALAGWVLELIALVLVLRGVAPDAQSAVAHSFRLTLKANKALWRLLGELICWLLPVGIAIAGTYVFLLSEFDINYYLAERPPEFWAAVAVVVVCVAYSAWALLRITPRWLCVPAMLCDGVDTAADLEAVASSVSVSRGARKLLVAQWVFALFALPGVMATLGSLLLWIAVPLWPRSLPSIAVGVGIMLLAGLLSSLLCNVLSTLLLAGLANATVHRAESANLPSTDSLKVGWRTGAFVGLALLLAACFIGAKGLEAVAPEVQVEIIAHRGASLIAPENTLSSVTAAIEAGADWVEIDVQETLDGEVIVFHDSDFMKTAGVATKVWDATSDQIANIDIGSKFGEEFAGETAPTLRAVLEACRDRVGVLIELKYYGHQVDLEGRVAQVVEKASMQDQVRFMSLKSEGVKRMKELRPDWDVGLLLSVYAGRLQALNADFLAMNVSFVSRALIETASDSDLPVYAWTVNDPIQMTTLAVDGAVGLITDDPALARQTLKEWRELPPLGRLLLHTAGSFGLHKLRGDPKEQ